MANIVLVKIRTSSGDFTPKNYAFFTDIKVGLGDMVACESANGPVFGKVVDLKPSEYASSLASRWIVSNFTLDLEKIVGNKVNLEIKKLEEQKREIDRKISKLTYEKDVKPVKKTNDNDITRWEW